MSEQKLSERVVIEITDNEWVGRRRRIAETWAHEIAALEAKLEAMENVVGIVRDILPAMIARGDLGHAAKLDFALQELDAAQQEGR